MKILGHPGKTSALKDLFNEAIVTREGALMITEIEREANVYARLAKTGISSSTGFILVDLSDNGGLGAAGYNHSFTDRIDISGLKLEVERDASAVGSLKVGVITAITATGANVSWFAGLDFSHSDDRRISAIQNFSPSQIKCGVSGGITTHFVTNDKSTNNTRFQNDTTIEAATGSNVIPAVGDIVLDFVLTAGTAGFSAAALYHSEDAGASG